MADDKRVKYSSREISTAPKRRVAGVTIWMSKSEKLRSRSRWMR